jgi:hypothetical protein
MRFAWMVVVTALAACGGSGNTPTGDGGPGGAGGAGGAGGNCDAESTLTASGALTGTRTARALYARHSGDSTNVRLIAQAGAPFIAGWSFTFPGAPGLTTYTEATDGVVCTATLMDSPEPLLRWAASKGIMDVPDQGTFRLTLTSATPTLDLGGPMEYCLHGTMTAALLADPRSIATGTVTLSTSF